MVQHPILLQKIRYETARSQHSYLILSRQIIPKLSLSVGVSFAGRLTGWLPLLHSPEACIKVEEATGGVDTKERCHISIVGQCSRQAHNTYHALAAFHLKVVGN